MSALLGFFIKQIAKKPPVEPPQKKRKVGAASAQEDIDNDPMNGHDEGGYTVVVTEEEDARIQYMESGKDVNIHVLSFLPVEDIVRFFAVSQSFYEECQQALKKVTGYVVNWGPSIDKDIMLIDAMQRCGVSMKYLNLVGKRVTTPKSEIPFKTLSRILKQPEKDVESLVLHTGDSCAEEDVMGEIFEIIAGMPKLRSLKLHTCRYPPSFNQFSAPHNLRELVLNFVNATLLFHVLGKCPHLEKLHLYQSGSLEDIFEQLDKCKDEFPHTQTEDGQWACIPHIKDLLIECPPNSLNQIIDNGVVLGAILKAFTGVEKLQLAQTVISRTVMGILPELENLRSIVCSRVVRQGWWWGGIDAVQPSVEEYHDTMATVELNFSDLNNMCRIYPNLRVLNVVCNKYDWLFTREISALTKLEHLYLYESRQRGPEDGIMDLLMKTRFPSLKKITVVKRDDLVNMKWEDFYDKLQEERKDIVFGYARSGIFSASLFDDFCK